MRERWGCDGPSPEPWGWIDPCPFCRGGSASCAQCGGDDRVGLYACPNRVVGQRELDAVGAVALVEQGVLPCSGGWSDQPATFVQAYPIVAREIHNWREVAMKQVQDKARRSRK